MGSYSIAPTNVVSLRPARIYRMAGSGLNFLLAYCLVSLSGLCVGLLLGWAMWG